MLDDGNTPQDMDDGTTIDTEAFAAANPSAAPTPDESQKQGSDADGPADGIPSNAESPEVGHNVDVPSPPPRDGGSQKSQVDSALLKPPRKRAHVEP